MKKPVTVRALEKRVAQLERTVSHVMSGTLAATLTDVLRGPVLHDVESRMHDDLQKMRWRASASRFSRGRAVLTDQPARSVHRLPSPAAGRSRGGDPMKCASCGTRSEPVNGILNCAHCGYSTPVPSTFHPVDVGNGPIPPFRPLTPPTPEEMNGDPMTGTCESCRKPCRERATFCLKCRIERDTALSLANERKRKARMAGVGV